MLIYIKPLSTFPKLHSDTLFGALTSAISELYPNSQVMYQMALHGQIMEMARLRQMELLPQIAILVVINVGLILIIN